MTTTAATWHTGQLVPGPVPGQKDLDTRFFQGWDIHVVRGATSPPLLSILMLEDDANRVRADDHALPADIDRFLFIGDFAGTLAGDVLSGGGVSLNGRTGEVTATAGPPTPKLRSFVVRAHVVLRGDSSIRLQPIRFHIHESVTEIWLTPSTLSLPGDAEGQRFSVLARFDDDTIGDITWLASAPSDSGQPPASGFDWKSSDNICVRVDKQGSLDGNFSLFSCTSTITATLKQANWPTLSASANVKCIEPWGEPPPGRSELHLLSGPGVNAVSDVANILILPDGFIDEQADRDDFSALASLVVTRLNRSSTTFPFSVLEGSINYWSVFVPSRERGTTTLDDLIEFATLFEEGAAGITQITTLAVSGQRPAGDRRIDFHRAALIGTLPADVHFIITGDPTLYTTKNSVEARDNALLGVQFTPALTRITANNARVTIIGQRMRASDLVVEGMDKQALHNLIAVVGLPAPAERLTHRSTDAELDTKTREWATLYGVGRIRPPVTHAIYDIWQDLLSDHRLADDKDTAFGLAVGDRPRGTGGNPSQRISWHPMRTQRNHLDRFLDTLKFEGTVIGSTWTMQPSGAPGKDRNLVFVLARGARYAGTNTLKTNPIIAASLVDDKKVRVRYGPGRSMQIVSHPMKRIRGLPLVTNFIHATVAHETAHSFGILDEYGDLSPTADSPFPAKDTFECGNLTPASEVAATGGIAGENLRWRWARINKAGVLAGPPIPDPPVPDPSLPNVRFKITLAPGRLSNLGERFLQGEVVFLRQRPLLRKHEPPQLTPALESPPLRIDSVGSAFEVWVRLPAGGGLSQFSGTGNEAPILFRPVPASASATAANDPYAEVMAQSIRNHITETKRPLNVPPPPPQPRPAYNCTPPATGSSDGDTQYATNLPGSQRPPITSRIIGAYEGGARYACGVFHPAGACIMRNSLMTESDARSANEENIANKELTRPLAEGSVNEFCHVCRYLIVDRVDPRRHVMIDLVYDNYPQP